MEMERQNLAEAVTLAERKYSDEKKRTDELQQQVKLHKLNWESSKQELIDYKQKATRILQVSMKYPLSDVKMCWLPDTVANFVAIVKWLLFGWIAWLYLKSL